MAPRKKAHLAMPPAHTPPSTRRQGVLGGKVEKTPDTKGKTSAANSGKKYPNLVPASANSTPTRSGSRSRGSRAAGNSIMAAFERQRQKQLTASPAAFNDSAGDGDIDYDMDDYHSEDFSPMTTPSKPPKIKNLLAKASPATPRSFKAYPVLGAQKPNTPSTSSTMKSNVTTPTKTYGEAIPKSRGRGPANTPKYGRCPECATGRRVRTRFHPAGFSTDRGKFRFVCSNRNHKDPTGEADGGCGYSQTLGRDPALDEESTWTDEGEKAAGVGGAVASPRNKGPPQLGCPMCQRGQLVKKCRDTFHYMERVLECSAQGCNYKLELERGSFRDVEGGEDEGFAKGKKHASGAQGKKTTAQQKKQQQEEEYDDTSFNPLAAATIYKSPTLKNKVLVDLTGDDMDFKILPTEPAAARSKQSSPLMEVGAEIIVIEDDSEAPADNKRPANEDFDELGSADEDALIRLTKEFEGDFDVEDELEFVRLADNVSASMTRK
ncbi:hypothetical protein N0V88_003771 [Collariella sp. IMI 366227]|nr:hypothetical protein N0V88_003771 [Collariella sp. IMI 366227]